MKKFFPLFFFFLTAWFNPISKACSPVNVPTLVSQAVSGSNLNLSWSSNTTYNCTYYIQVEIVCNNATFPGTGNPPFYQSATITKTSTPFPYPLQSINISSLCPGTVYKFRAREVYSAAPTIFSAWTATFTFTTPGTFVQPTLTLTATPPMICVPQTSQLNCTIQNACGPTSPTYSWVPAASLNNPAISNPVASPTTTTTYTCYVTGGLQGCWTANGSVTVTSTVPPVAGTANVSPATICAGNTVTLTLTGYTGTIQWQSGPTSSGPWTNITGATTTPYITAPLAGNTCFQAVVTGCGTVTSNAVCVTVNPAPVANAGANVSICQGASTTLNGSGGGTYSWAPSGSLSNNSVSNPVATPTVTTTYTLTVTQSGCSSTAQVTVTVNPLPTVTIVPANPSICAGGNINLTASGASTYSWSPATGLNQTTGAVVNASPTATTTYTVTATSVSGCTSTTSVTVTVSGNLIVTITPNSTICQGSNIVLNAGTGVSYSWSPASSLSSSSVSNPTATPTTTTTYTVVVTNSSGCTGSNTVTITVSPTITLNMAGYAQTCPGVCNGQAICIPSGGMGGPFFSWSNSGTNASIGPVCPGTYTVTVTDGVGCTATGTATVNAVPQIVLTSNTPASNCNLPNGSATVNASGGTPGYTYSWTPGNQTTQTATGLAGGNYTVTVTDANGCTRTLAITVPSNAAVTASIPSSTNVTCFGACNGTANSLASSGAPPYSYSWSNGQTTQNISGLCAGTYTVTIRDGNNCTSTATVTIMQPPQLSVNASVPGPICVGALATLSASASGGTGAYSYSWAPSGGSASTASVSPTSTTVYTVTVTDANNCTRTGTVTVTVNPLPVVIFSGIDTTGCVPLTVTFTNNTLNSSSCSWNFGNSTTSASCGNPVTCIYTSPGVYTVSLTVTNTNGCVRTSTHTNMVTVNARPTSCFTMNPQPTTILNPAISFTDCSTGGVSSWSWSFGDVLNSTSVLQNPQFTYNDTGKYTVRQVVCNPNGCCDSSSRTVIIGPDFTFFVPNAFTPDGDGKNEEFFPVGTGMDITSYHIWIFDRWGNLFFQTDNWYKHWDGKLAGNPVPEDVYIWTIEISDYLHMKHKYVGHVSVIR